VEKKNNKEREERIRTLIGSHVGHLFVEENVGIDVHGDPLFLCECGQCRKKILVPLRDLVPEKKKLPVTFCGRCSLPDIEKKEDFDLTDTQYGILTVQKFLGFNMFRDDIWLCECACGSEICVSRRQLESPFQAVVQCLSCKSIRKRVTRCSSVQPGMKFGKLTADRQIRRRGENRKQGIMWMCTCDCGGKNSKNVRVYEHHLRSGNTKSCGCLRKENMERKKQMVLNSSYLWKDSPNEQYRTYGKNADQRGLPFELDLEDFEEIIAQPCFYCGNFSAIEKNGVDRFDNRLGYIRENCVSCCGKCNRAKWTMSPKEFMEWAGRLSVHLFDHGQQQIIEEFSYKNRIALNESLEKQNGMTGARKSPVKKKIQQVRRKPIIGMAENLLGFIAP